ncbi:CRISPR-associated ring nuclease Csm6 [Nitrosococcus halophilus]|uniref:CRISPR-associated ring nuclease Csm6 n=1 Tax=Nitrosococcus halophilus TaxID=133539 RepID=UPI000A306117|nr:CRISPR-associated ring nuclease Csm6 [Nitrosococcus halophilus]
MCTPPLSPQVVTETVYALAQAGDDALPTEVHVLTTEEGAERAHLTLLFEEPGWFRRLCQDYGLEGVHFDDCSIHRLTDQDGRPLSDIRTPEDNQQAADAITDYVRMLTADPESCLHVSIAGGRKTMGFYAGYALSLFGRPQDRLSHVLVSPPYESHPDFFYPTPYSRVIYTPGPDSRPLDTRQAQVTLAEIPFVSLRHGIPEGLLAGKASFSGTVAAAQRRLGPPDLVIDTTRRQILCSGEVIPLPPADFAFYLWFVRRKLQQLPLLHWSEAPAQDFINLYRSVTGELSGNIERVEMALRSGFTKEYFEQRKSRVNSGITRVLGVRAQPYLLQASGNRPRTRFGLALPVEQIRILPTETSKDLAAL